MLSVNEVLGGEIFSSCVGHAGIYITWIPISMVMGLWVLGLNYSRWSGVGIILN